MQPLLSIIIPVYNIADYIEQCVGSILQQDFRDYEIILVDDGSTDHSPEICRSLAARDSRIRIIRQKNLGLSGARNAGLRQAQGSYIFYLDGDDWLKEHALETLDKAIRQEADLILFGFYYTYPDYLLLHKSYTKPGISVPLSKDESMHLLLENDELKNFAWSCLIKRELAQRVLFPEGKFFEDCYWKHLIIHQATKIVSIPEPLYYYRQRESGISGSLSVKHLDLLEGNRQRLLFIRTQYPNLLPLAVKQHWKLCYGFLKAASDQLSESEQIPFQKFFDEATQSVNDLSDIRMPLSYSLSRNIPILLPLWEFVLKVTDKFSAPTFIRLPQR